MGACQFRKRGRIGINAAVASEAAHKKCNTFTPCAHHGTCVLKNESLSFAYSRWGEAQTVHAIVASFYPSLASLIAYDSLGWLEIVGEVLGGDQPLIIVVLGIAPDHIDRAWAIR